MMYEICREGVDMIKIFLGVLLLIFMISVGIVYVEFGFDDEFLDNILNVFTPSAIGAVALFFGIVLIDSGLDSLIG